MIKRKLCFTKAKFLPPMRYQSSLFIIRSQFFFLFISRDPTTWPTNNGLLMRNVVQLCLAANNNLLIRKRKHAFLLAIALAWKWLIASLPQDITKKQTRWSSDKTIIELGYRKISWFVGVSQINYLPQPICLPVTNHVILFNLVQ